jgi:hypothetical protein
LGSFGPDYQWFRRFASQRAAAKIVATRLGARIIPSKLMASQEETGPYSYGSHFPVAWHVTNERGEREILFTTSHHSATTSGALLGCGERHSLGRTRFRVPHLRNSWGDLPNHADNVEIYVRRISELLGKAKRARVHRAWYQRGALILRQQLQRYVAFFDLVAAARVESIGLQY